MLKTLAERCAKVELLVLDVDGVLTDGGIIYDNDGKELKVFHVRDGAALRIWQLVGKRAAIITGRSSRVVNVRAAELDISPVLQGVRDKFQAYRQLLREEQLQPEQVCCMGDDIPDLGLLRNCGLAVAVADACAEARADAHFVTHAAGGRGAVRETVELLLRCQNLWDAVAERYRNQSLVDTAALPAAASDGT